jgi:DNA-binding FadR family transcriptional regulator
MMEQFETSRVTVREALKNLENSGILEIRSRDQGVCRTVGMIELGESKKVLPLTGKSEIDHPLFCREKDLIPAARP